ncbi:MAG: type II CAAX endopeptidase family protein [Deltaproteobacteria bacterium]|nr:type II CAAX endopeptidase family protein [Deltaproteobacteria bacterium]
MNDRLRARLSLLFGLVSVLVALGLTHSLIAEDRVMRVAREPREGPNTSPRWQTTLALPRSATVRAVLCPGQASEVLREDPASALVLRGLDGIERARQPLGFDEGRARRCIEATAHAGGVVRVELWMSPHNARLGRAIDVFSHRRIAVYFAIPSVLLVAAVALALLGPRAPERDLVGDEDADAEGAGEPPVQWPHAWLYAIGAYLLIHFLNAMVSLVLMSLRRPVPGSIDGVSVLLGALAQHAIMIVVSLAMLGALSRKTSLATLRERSGFGPMSIRQAIASVLAASVLVSVAFGAARWIPDLANTPMGQLLERAPPRYAIAVGAMLAPLSEELFFRGVLVRAFGRRSVWLGALASVVFFTAAHVLQLWGAWAALVPIFAVGATNAVLRAHSRGLAQPWLVHTLYNGALTVGLFFT